MASGNEPRSLPPRTETTAVIIRALLVRAGANGESRLTASMTPMMSMDPSVWRSMRVQNTARPTYGPVKATEEPDCEVSDMLDQREKASARAVRIRGDGAVGKMSARRRCPPPVLRQVRSPFLPWGYTGRVAHLAPVCAPVYGWFDPA